MLHNWILNTKWILDYDTTGFCKYTIVLYFRHTCVCFPKRPCVVTWATGQSAVLSCLRSKGVRVHCCNKNLTSSAFQDALITSVTVQLRALLCFCSALAIGIVLPLALCAKRSLRSWEPECCSSNAGHFRTVWVYPPAVLLMHIKLHYRVVVHWFLHIHHYTVFQTHMHACMFFGKEPITHCVSYRCLYCIPFMFNQCPGSLIS